MPRHVYICSICGREYDEVTTICDCELLGRPKQKMVAKGISLYITFDPGSSNGDRPCASIHIQNKYNFNFVRSLYGEDAEELYSLLDVEEE